jgi:hypothetical protein
MQIKIHKRHPVGLKRQRKAAQDPVLKSYATQLHSYLFFIIASLRDNYFEPGSCAKSLRDSPRACPVIAAGEAQE